MAFAASRARDTGFTSGNIIFRPLRDDEFVMPMHPEAEADICAHICGAP